MSGKGIASIAKNASYLGGSRGINYAARFIYVIGLAHYLGPKIYGLYNYGMSWYMAFLPLTGLGLGVILSREVGRDRNQVARVVAQTLTLRTVTAIVAAIVCAIVGWISEGEPEARRLLLIFSVALTGRALAMWTDSFFTSYEVSKYSFQQNLIFRPLEAAFGLLLLFAGNGVVAVAILHTISWWFQAVRGLALVMRRIVTVRLHWGWRGLKSILAQGLPIGLGAIVVTWLVQGPLVLFRHMVGTGNSLGQLALAMQAFFHISAVTGVASAASIPVLSRAVARDDGKDALFAQAVVRAAFIFGAAAGLAGIAAGPWAVDMVFGARYGEAGRLLGLAIWLLIPWTCGTAIWNVYLARGQFFLPTMCAGIGAMVLTLIMPWLVSAMDIQGAVLATGAGMSIWALTLVAILARSGDLDVYQAIVWPSAAIVLALGVYFILETANVWLALAASWLVLFGGAMVFGILTPDERSALIGITRRRCSSSGAEHRRAGSCAEKMTRINP